MMEVNLNENQLDFIADAAFSFDGMISTSKANLFEVGEVLSFLLSLYGLNMPLDDIDKSVLRRAYKIIKKRQKELQSSDSVRKDVMLCHEDQ